MAITTATGYTHLSGGLVTPTRLNTAIQNLVISAAASKLLGTTGAGPIVEIAYTADGLALLQAASASAQKALVEKAVSPITAMAALDVDCSQGVYFTKTINGASVFTFSNVPAGGAYGFTLELTHTSGAITWPASVKWPNDTAPTLTTGRTHLCSFVTSNGGTRWRGAVLPNYVT